MAIKIDRSGQAVLTHDGERGLVSVALGRVSWKQSRRNARKGGLKYFRLRGLDMPWSLPEHLPLDGLAFDARSDFFDCRCCFPEWLFNDADIAVARAEIHHRRR